MLPAAEDFDSPISKTVETYYSRAAGMSAKERVGLYKLAWDLCGDAFGSSQVQYERYHLGDPVRNLATMFLSYDKRGADEVVARALSLMDAPAEKKGAQAKTTLRPQRLAQSHS